MVLGAWIATAYIIFGWVGGYKKTVAWIEMRGFWGLLVLGLFAWIFKSAGCLDCKQPAGEVGLPELKKPRGGRGMGGAWRIVKGLVLTRKLISDKKQFGRVFSVAILKL